MSKNINRMSEDTKSHQDFDLWEDLEAGSFNRIFKVKDKRDNNEYAIKIIKFKYDMEYAGKYRSAAHNLCKLSHNHIVRYYSPWIETAHIPLSQYDAMTGSDNERVSFSEIHKLAENGYINSDSVDNEDREDDSKMVKYLFIQMESCENRTLETAIDDNLYLDEGKINKYFRQMCEGLLHIHQNRIVHLDLEPKNIFLTCGDDIKIGNFGFCKQVYVEDEFENLAIDDHVPCYSLIDICQTGMHTAPEFYDGRHFFNTKSDIYSLGVIYYEMCSKPMTVIDVLFLLPITPKKLINNCQFAKNNSRKKFLLRNMLHTNYDERPTCDLILKILDSEKSLGEMEKIMQQSKKTPYPQLRTFTKNLEENVVEKCDLMSSFVKAAVKIFELHGGHNIAVPTFLPTCNRYSDTLINMLDVHGNSVSVSNTSRIAFCHYVKTNNLQALRRYSVGKIFEERYHLPVERQECVFEAISLKSDHVADAEMLYMVKEICNEICKTGGNEITFSINHRRIFSTIMKNFGLETEQLTLFTNMLVKRSKNMIDENECQKLIYNMNPELNYLIDKIGEPCNINEAKEVISSVMGNQYEQQLTAALEELKIIVEIINKFGIESKYIFVEPLLVTDRYSSGFMFKATLTKPKTLIATGERFDSLINKIVKTNKKYQPKLLSGIGISFHADDIVKLLKSSNVTKSAIDVAIYIDGSNKTEAIPFYMKLLTESIKCQIITEIPKSKSSDKPPIVLVHLFTDNNVSSLIYTVQEPSVASNMPWNLNQIHIGSWKDDEFLEIIKKQIKTKN